MKAWHITSCFLLWSSWLQAYPCYLYRLIKLQNGSIIKTVDIIADAHIPNQKTPCTKEEQFSPTENALIHTLKNLAHQKRKEPIMLLWEWNKEFKIAPQRVFLEYGGTTLHKEFTSAKSSIIFVPSDTYRYNRQYIEYLLAPEEPHYQHIANHQIKDAFAFMIDPLSGNNSKHLALIDLQKIQDPIIKKNELESWHNYVKDILQQFYTIHIKPYQTMSLYDFVKLPKFNDFMRKFTSLILFPIADREFLFKILGPEHHIIMYAGRDHCDAAIKTLRNNYQYEILIACGTHSTKHDQIMVTPDTWNYLKQVPHALITLSKKEKSYHHVINQTDIDTFFNAIAKDNKKTVISLIKKSDLAHADLVNAERSDGKTPLTIALENNLFSMIDLLLHNGAIPDTQTDYFIQEFKKIKNS